MDKSDTANNVDGQNIREKHGASCNCKDCRKARALESKKKRQEKRAKNLNARAEKLASMADGTYQEKYRSGKTAGEKRAGFAGLSGAAAFMVGCSFFVSLAAAGVAYVAYDKASTPITFLSSGTDGNSANFVEGSVADLVDTVSASVVSIVTSVETTGYSWYGGAYTQTSQAAGTGIIATSDGYIITNNHVIEDAKTISVILDDGTTYENVTLAASDPLNDVAYLKIDGVTNLHAATLGDSKTISTGQEVIAIGNALGEYQNTVTSGIISGTGRSVTAYDSTGTNAEYLTDLIQTDAAINSGNSGGPLINAAGEVIGINVATTTDANNIGFAIPISSAKGMLNSLIKNGTAKRSYVGVYSISITASTAAEYELPVTAGAYLYTGNSGTYSPIVSGSPAAKAGLKEKDIITAVNGVKVGAAGSLTSLTGEYMPGDTVQLTVLRSGKEIAVNLTLGEYPETSTSSNSGSGSSNQNNDPSKW